LRAMACAQQITDFAPGISLPRRPRPCTASSASSRR
jgi:hypothetical protein